MRLAIPILLLLALATRAEEKASFDEILPDDAILYVSVRSVPRTLERYREGALRPFWEDPAVAGFTAHLREGWNASMARMKEKTGAALDEALDLVAGEVAFCVPAGGIGPSGMRYVLLADIGANGERVAEILAAAERALLDGDRYRRLEEEFRGVKLVSYQSTKPEEEGEEGCGEEGPVPPEPLDEDGEGEELRAGEAIPLEEPETPGGGGEPTCWCLSEGIFAAATDLETLKAHMAAREAEGGPPRLAAHGPYRRVVSKTGARRDLVAYFGLPSMMGALRAQGAFDEEDERIFAAVGFASIDAIGGQIGIERDGFGADIFVGVPGKKVGLLKMFDAPNEGLRPPAMVDPAVDNVGSWLIDLPGLWAEFRRIANTIKPGMLETVDGYLEMFKGASGVDIQTDFIGALGKEITWYTAQREAAGDGEGAAGTPPPGMGRGGMPSLVIALSVADHQRMEGALNGMQGAAQGMIREEEYLGIKMRNVVLPFPIRPCYALLPDHLVLALDVEDLKGVIRRVGKEVKSLRDTPEFERCAARIPEGRIAVGFTREARAMRQSFVGGFLLGFSAAMRGEGVPFDMNAFPPLEVLERYLDVGSSSITNDEAGVHMRYFMAMHPPMAK